MYKTKNHYMKKYFIVAMAILATLISCNSGGDGTVQDNVYADDPYMAGKLDVFNQTPVSNDDIVMFGDDWLDLGEWASFFGVTNIRNRGIRGDKAALLPARTDSIASKKPLKVFVSAGANDIRGGGDSKTIQADLRKVFARFEKLSPNTALYYLNCVPTADMTSAQKDELLKLNTAMAEGAAKGGYTCIDLCGTLAQGIADGTYSWNGGKYLNGAGYEAYTGLIAEAVGSQALNHAADVENGQVEKYLEGWYGCGDPASCMPPDYYRHKLSVFRSLPPAYNGIVMLGNSLTDFVRWEDLLSGVNVIGRGIAGDMIEGMALRLDDVAAQKPNKVFVMAGCNNLVKYPETDALAVFEKYLDLVRKIHSSCPKATVYVQSILPLNPIDPACKEFNPAADKVNAALKEAAKTNDFIFIDVTAPLKDENGDLRLECTTDGCHLNATGYFTWATELLQTSRLMIIGDPYLNAN